MKTKLRSQKGFTIIEVLIVLAIAGLILLIVFLAVPALQRNSRNTQRTTEGARVAASVSECLANRNGSKPACDTALEVEEGTLQQLTLEAGPFTDVQATASAGYSTTVVTVDYQRKCLADGSDSTAGGPRDFAVMFVVEPAINRCIDS